MRLAEAADRLVVARVQEGGAAGIGEVAVLLMAAGRTVATAPALLQVLADEGGRETIPLLIRSETGPVVVLFDRDDGG